MEDRRQIRAHVRWKLRLQNDVQTEGRPRPPPGNTVITIITYRALILISPSYVSLSLTHTYTPYTLSFSRLSLLRDDSFVPSVLFSSWSVCLVVRVDIFPRPFTRADQLRFIIARERRSCSLTRAFDSWFTTWRSFAQVSLSASQNQCRWLLHV